MTTRTHKTTLRSKAKGGKPGEAVARVGKSKLPKDPTFRKSQFGRPVGSGNFPSYKVPDWRKKDIAERELSAIKNTGKRCEEEQQRLLEQELYGTACNFVRSILEIPGEAPEKVYGSTATRY
jgi:hypothetical protein